MKIFTSRYGNAAVVSEAYVPVGISQGYAKWLSYTPVYLKALAPSWAMVGMTDREAYKVKYFSLLENLGIERIQQLLEEVSGGKDVVLLCFEDLRKPDKWCHRTMFAEWYEGKTGIAVEELPEAIKEKKTESKGKQIKQQVFAGF